jgi:hypothetical protein
MIYRLLTFRGCGRDPDIVDSHKDACHADALAGVTDDLVTDADQSSFENAVARDAFVEH